jgi:TfoX/Sxy family transcriptional regulator of competence genes
MAWRKSSPELVRAFDSALPQSSLVERRKMFGYSAAFVHGNLFAGLHQEDVLVRLPEVERQALLSRGGRNFEPMPGRVMKNYLLLPEASDGRTLSLWLRKAFDHTSQLPAKGTRAANSAQNCWPPSDPRPKGESDDRFERNFRWMPLRRRALYRNHIAVLLDHLLLHAVPEDHRRWPCAPIRAATRTIKHRRSSAGSASSTGQGVGSGRAGNVTTLILQ